MKILDGKKISDAIIEDIGIQVEQLKKKAGRAPGLAVIIAGDDPASAIYVRSKEKKASRLGFDSRIISMPATVTDDALESAIAGLNSDPAVDGILIQLPLPEGLETWKFLDMIDPGKDVDRFHPVNLGLLTLGRTDIYPCTPGGILRMIDEYGIDVSGMNCAVIGRSYIVGKPMTAMLTNRNATVTLCHSRTKDIPGIVAESDLVVAAVGIPGFVTPSMVRKGAVLIDVGINRIDSLSKAQEFCTPEEVEKFKNKGYSITGDIHPSAFDRSSFYTPVPGGVGLMTVAMLMENTFRLFKKRTGLE